MRRVSAWAFLLFAVSAVSAQNLPPVSPYIVVGFVGGYVKRNDRVHSVVQLTEKLRRDYPAGVSVEVFENHHAGDAHDYVMHLLDANHDGKWSPAEKSGAKVVLFGHSWGASEVVQLARALEKDGVPVLLTIQVDSVTKRGQDDEVVPGNVKQAVNFYQPRGIIHGEEDIRAADPTHTQILGNYRYDYSKAPISCEGYPWWNQIFMHSHMEIECDPKVWDQVEALIRSKLPTQH
jgi:hypothetical protein